MKARQAYFLLLIGSVYFTSFSQNKTPKVLYNSKEFHTLYDFFENKSDLIKFFDIKPGEVIADVGAAEGYHEGALSLLYDSLTFYIEDIDPKDVNQKEIDKTVKHYNKLRSTPQTCKFNWVLGTYKTTNLPDGIFDKIIMIASFHEFTYMDEMMNDISKKLKPGGKIYIMEAFCIDKVIRCEEGHKGYYMKEVNEIMSKIGYYQTQMSSPESYIINYANVLVFEKDKPKSDLFFQKKSDLQPLLNKSFLFGKHEVAADSNRVNVIADSLLPAITKLTDQYVVYEAWLKNIGLKWKKAGRHTEAINILKACTKLFPQSAQNYALLGEVYLENKQQDLAGICFDKACNMGVESKFCSKK